MFVPTTLGRSLGDRASAGSSDVELFTGDKVSGTIRPTPGYPSWVPLVTRDTVVRHDGP